MTSTDGRDRSKGDDPRRALPSVERLLSSEPFVMLAGRFTRAEVKREVVRILEEARRTPGSAVLTSESIVATVESSLETGHDLLLRRVINGTGILIHTNLGRSPIGQNTWTGAADDVTGYTNLEYDLASGERGKRDELLEPLAQRLFGCESAILANNNAAAVLLLLAAVSPGREVLVSRSELVEIGGSFRVPDIIQQGGAKLREVGTTNRTRAADFLEAAGRRTGAILSVHQSNFQIVGFTEAPTVAELADVARRKKIPFLIDEGSGRVVDLAVYGLGSEPTISQLLASGVDAVTCSTDKLIGSLQGGLILGSRDIIEKCARHPLMRALRAGKESYALLGRTLLSFLQQRHEAEIPLYRMLSTSVEVLRTRAATIIEESSMRIIETRSAVGGGTTPSETVPSIAVALAGDASSHARLLRSLARPIVGRILDDHFTLDLRTIDPADDVYLRERLRLAIH